MGVHFSHPRTGTCQLRIQGHRNSVISVAASPFLTTNGGLFATGSGDHEAKIWVYTYAPAQQKSQLQGLETIEFVPSAPQDSQTSQHGVQQLPSDPQCSSRPPLQTAPTPANTLSDVPQQNVASNIPSQHRISQNMAGSTSQSPCINTWDSQPGRAQRSDQASLPPGAFPGVAAEALPITNAPQGMTPPTKVLQAQAQSSAKIGSPLPNKERKLEPKTCLELLETTRLFALQTPQRYPQRLEKLYSVRDSLPQGEEKVRNNQELRANIEGEIQKIEALYRDLLQSTPEEVKDGLITIKEKTVTPMRQQLEEHDKQVEAFRAARENRAEIEKFKQQVLGLRAKVPDVIRALQGLEAFLNEEFEFLKM
jgi:hypothetical protein